jgi:predicted aconitase
MTLQLTPDEQAMLAGRAGKAVELAMRILIEMAGVARADRFLEVTSAHIDGGLYHGRAGLDFAERLATSGARVGVPTTLNVSSLDLLHPDLYRGDTDTAAAARRLMDFYVEMGCRPSWTCAPYQLPQRPAFGEHVAWAESNAIAFANSVLGARTERYGDFIDICAAIAGRVPDAGLHRDENRAGEILFQLSGLSAGLLDSDVLYPVLGHLVGAEAGTSVPVIAGLPADTSEDRLKALGAAAASSGAVALFHAVRVTPEAPTIEAAFRGRKLRRTVEVTTESLRAARNVLSTVSDGSVAAVSLGTPHASLAELEELAALLIGNRVHPDVDFFVSTGRGVLGQAETGGTAARLRDAGVQIVVDTCTYITPILRPRPGAVMTNSAKWAYYAPGNIGVEVVFGSTEECVRSAVEGRVWRDDGLWHDA